MAGFRGRGEGPVDVRVVPHPAVTLVLEFGNGPLVVDAATGRQQRGNLVAGFPHGAMRVRGENVECVQVRLSPVVARAVLGVSPAELDRTVVALDDLWGRDAARIRQRLGDATSWPDRSALAEALWSRFRSQIGLAPKRAARLVRFDHAAHRLAAGEGAAQVAADGGYADQSHLYRDVRAFTAVTPATVIGEPWLAVDGIAWAVHGVGEVTP